MKDWIVETAEFTMQGDGLRAIGINNSTTNELDRNFRWLLSKQSCINDRFDFTNTVWGPGAKERFDQLVKQAK